MFARTARARPAAESEPARKFVVELRRQKGRIAGTLVVEETGGTSMARHVTGSECGHVATVLALATALAIDPHAELAPDQELESEPAPAVDRVDRPERRSTAPAESPASTAPSSATQNPLSDEAPDAPRRRAQGGWFARASLGASAAFGIAPQPSIGPYAMIAARRDRGVPFEELGLGLVFRTGAPELVRGAKADFRFYAARPTLCIRGVELSTALHAAPCLVFEAGAVDSAGSELPVTERATRFWAAAEALLRVEHALPATFFVGLEGGAALPLTRYRYVFENPDTPIHEVPAVTAEVTLRLGTRL